VSVHNIEINRYVIADLDVSDAIADRDDVAVSSCSTIRSALATEHVTSENHTHRTPSGQLVDPLAHESNGLRS
jgi:hypothetical protein